MKKSILFAALLFLPVALSCDNNKSPTQSTKTYAVKFLVRGIINTVDIEYNDGSGLKLIDNRLGSALPWELTVSAPSGTQIMLRAKINEAVMMDGKDFSYVVTYLDLDGEAWRSKLEKGQGAVSEVSGTVP